MGAVIMQFNVSLGRRPWGPMKGECDRPATSRNGVLKVLLALQVRGTI